MGTKKLKPGKPAPKSGQYKEPGKKEEITAVKGKPLPPTSKPGKEWKLTDPTKHKKK